MSSQTPGAQLTKSEPQVVNEAAFVNDLNNAKSRIITNNNSSALATTTNDATSASNNNNNNNNSILSTRDTMLRLIDEMETISKCIHTIFAKYIVKMNLKFDYLQL